MASNAALKLQQSPLGVALPGCWKLTPARAFTLNPDQAGVFRVAQGQIWATLEGPHHGPANDWGDVVLHAGEQLVLTPGQQVVVEPFGDAVNEPAYFCWEPSRAPAPSITDRLPRWHDPLARPALDLAGALSPAAGAIRRLLRALTGGLQLLVAGKGRVLPYYESNQP